MSATQLAQALSGDHYLVRAKFFKIFGQAFHVYDPAGNLLLYCKLKAFKLKEDIRLFASEAEQNPLLAIKARSIIDFGAAYDIIDLTAGGGSANPMDDTAHGEKIGALRRKGFSSMFRDAWEILDAHDQPIGTITEDSAVKALIRRFVEAAATFMPQAFHGEVNGQRVFEMKQNFNPFIAKLNCDFSMDTSHLIDRRLGMAAAILMMAIEGRQNR